MAADRIPPRSESGEITITMTVLRSQPGEVMDFVIAGGTVHITRNGRNVATIAAHSDAFFERFAKARPSLLRD